MKILREGIIQPVDKTWWHGRSARCADCGCVVGLEEGDDKKPGPEQVSFTAKSVWCSCPTCGGTCRLSLDEARFFSAAGVNRQ